MSADSTTASAQRRRVTKPLMERRRRARINSCLAQLKEMVIVDSPSTVDIPETRTCRLEKADILEMTVQHVKKLNCLLGTKKSYNAPFEDGYRRCVEEVARFVAERNKIGFGDDEKLWKSLLRHLQQSLPSRFAECPCLPRGKSNIIAVSCQLKEVVLTSDEERQSFPKGGAFSSHSDDDVTQLNSSRLKNGQIHLEIKSSPKFGDFLARNPRWQRPERVSSQQVMETMWRPW